MGAALQADGEYEVRGDGLKHQKEKRSMDHFAGLDVSVKETSGQTRGRLNCPLSAKSGHRNAKVGDHPRRCRLLSIRELIERYE